MGTLIVVRARPPARVPRPVRVAAEPLAVSAESVRKALPEPAATARASKPSEAQTPAQLAPGAALRTFRKLVAGWNLREDRAWRMLTGDDAALTRLTEDQARRVEMLAELDATVASIMANVGAWLIEPNPGPLLMGRSPLEFLSRAGTPGYVSLLRTAQGWARL